MIKEEVFTVKEIAVLSTLIKHSKTSRLDSTSINNLVPLLEQNKSGSQSLSTIRRNVNKLTSCGFISEGIKIGKKKTYYINKEGLAFYEELTSESEEDYYE